MLGAWERRAGNAVSRLLSAHGSPIRQKEHVNLGAEAHSRDLVGLR